MKILKFFLFAIFICLTHLSLARPMPLSKQFSAIKYNGTRPIIDGYLTDSIWQTAAVADDFVQFEPNNGSPASEKSEVRFAYTDEAVYIGAILYDSNPNSIHKELSR
ncbi:DOMON domain-containing protein [Williamwhitmania taraxaci]|uniref:Carbohydrate family 9 binding domain-like n=1 Tax=Williamwhitmania taraxaci TaxID=1640674 RepID=A0A1G6HWR2_9BACT|nr:hypothetical protein [Williamwhitmania taraxaci]SDB98747.1 hypothetical protein SAMN05216323_101363 [Williamwhitmania taraxaci]